MPQTAKSKLSGESFEVPDEALKILENFGLPLPTLTPRERHRRRLAHRNERSIYRNTCAMTQKPIISMYPENSGYKVLSPEVWWGDSWDPKDYGRDFDFDRPFFEQFKELQEAVPKLALMNRNGVNSDYCNITTDNKNCYLVFGGDFNQDCLEAIFCFHCSDASDTYWVHRSELVFDCTDSTNLYNVKHAVNSHNCQDSAFIQDCRNVKNCFGCIGLVNKEYHIFNQPVPKEEYEERVEAYRIHTWSGLQRMREQWDEFRLQFPHRAQLLINSENAHGDRIVDAKNIQNSFDVYGPAEDIIDTFLTGWNAKNLYSCSQVGHKIELAYESVATVACYNVAVCTTVWDSSNVMYSDLCMNSEDLFGCVALKREKYCILNKQYSETEYHELREKIIEHMKKTGEWGEFFPMENSPFAYNQTVVQDYFPIDKEKAKAEGFKWHDEEKRPIPESDSIPDSIEEVDDSILKESLVCHQTGRPYRVTPMGLKLLRKLRVPVPRFAPETRHEIRIRKRNPFKLWDRECDSCGAAVQTSYAPERPEKIYCDACYMKDRY